jgi:hypothetical protein
LPARLVAGTLLAAAIALIAVTAASAQAEIGIVSLNCDDDPEEVVIENSGDVAQDLAGWTLESDADAEPEVFDLSTLGSLQPGASVFIRSGPSATGVFTWSENFIFRDGDATDYVRIVDDAGATIGEMSCEAAAQTTPTAEPTAEPTPAPAHNVPNGGGAPPDAGGLSAMTTVGIGALMAALGSVAVAFSRIGARLTGAGPSLAAPAGAPEAPPRRRGAPVAQRPKEQTLGRIILAVATLALLLFLVRRS